jgi:Secretion system C-terminal sorting domain/Cohesin domain
MCYAERKEITMRNLLMLTMLALALTALPAAAVPPYPGTVSIDSVDAIPGEQITLGVYLTGGEVNISALRIPLKYNASLMTIDSISYVGSFIPSEILTLDDIDNGAGTVNILFSPELSVPIPTMPKSGGLLATIHAKIAAVAPQTTLSIDSIFQVDSVVVGPGEVTYYGQGLQASDSTGTQVLNPGFVSGKVRITLSTGVDDDIAAGLPKSFAVNQNYPNPFNPSTIISFSIPRQSNVKIEVFNLLGQKVMTLADGTLPAGNHQVSWDASNNPSGVYFYRVSWSGGNHTRKMVLVK